MTPLASQNSSNSSMLFRQQLAAAFLRPDDVTEFIVTSRLSSTSLLFYSSHRPLQDSVYVAR